ncbi:TolC family protein [Vibrio hangzhouensis]|uniref:TolC family protein n=1 Tax=Vibrio hangzhouensis TaxID=462991 RepID=UPI003965895A
MNKSINMVTLALSVALTTPAMSYASNLSGNSHSQSVVQTSTTLEQLIEFAIANDANRTQYFAQSEAMRQSGIASATLNDPVLKVGVGGLPTDSFRLDEDPMTNVSVGLMQQFGRGSTLDLQNQKAQKQADGIEYQVDVRELDIANSISKLWFELGFQQQSERVLLENQKLMREMERFIQTNYAIGNSESQDLIQAQLQVSRLDEKIQANRQMQTRIISQMSEWLGSQWLASQPIIHASTVSDWTLLDSRLSAQSHSGYYALLNQHPMARMADVQIATSETQVAIAAEAYKPQFGVEAMYAHRRANNMRGEPAPDLVSAYVTMDIPLFTGNRQDKNHAAAEYQVVASKSSKDALLSQMNANVSALVMDRQNLSERLGRYQQSLLPQAEARTRAVERGYENNTAQFSDVITAASDELAIEIEALRLETDLSLVNSNLSYFLGGFNFQAERPTLATPSKQQ